MSAAPPADYVAFVDRRLPELRARVAGEVPASAPDQAEVLGEVLAELAGRWTMLRAAARLGRPDLIDRQLDRTVRRRGRSWRERQIYPVEVTVWADAGAAPPRPAPALVGPVPAPAWRVSVALRRASVLDSTVRPGFVNLAEASVAWWHAYEARRRVVRIARLTLVVLVLLFALTARH